LDETAWSSGVGKWVRRISRVRATPRAANRIKRRISGTISRSHLVRQHAEPGRRRSEPAAAAGQDHLDRMARHQRSGGSHRHSSAPEAVGGESPGRLRAVHLRHHGRLPGALRGALPVTVPLGLSAGVVVPGGYAGLRTPRLDHHPHRVGHSGGAAQGRWGTGREIGRASCRERV